MSYSEIRTINGRQLCDIQARADIAAQMPSVISITLTASSWIASGDNYTQTVSVTGGTVKSSISIQPSPDYISQLIADGVTALMINNDNGTFVAIAMSAAPSTDMTIQIIVTETA